MLLSTWNAQAADKLSMTVDCETTVCTSSQRAEFDLVSWRRRVRNELPQGAAIVQGNRRDGIDITLMWMDKEQTSSEVDPETGRAIDRCKRQHCARQMHWEPLFTTAAQGLRQHLKVCVACACHSYHKRRTMIVARTKLSRYTRGLTLVELMIAMAIGLAIVIAATVIYVTTAKNQRALERKSSSLESGDFCVEAAGKEIMNAGFYPATFPPAVNVVTQQGMYDTYPPLQSSPRKRD